MFTRTVSGLSPTRDRAGPIFREHTSDRARVSFTAARATDIFTLVEVTTPKVSLLQAHDRTRRRAA